MNNQKGISLLLVVLISSVILAIGLGISSIIIQQTKMMENIGYSVIAFYAADTGIEAALYDLYRSEIPRFDHSNVIDNAVLNDAYYDTEAKCCHFGSIDCHFGDPDNLEDERPDCPWVEEHTDCNALNFCLESAGGYKTIKRAIKIRY